MEEENGTVFRNFFFSILKEYVCVCGKGEGKYLGSFDYIYIYVFFGEGSLET